MPPGYDASGERRYPVAYFLDGRNTLEKGETVAILDHAIGRTVAPFVGVFLLPPEEDPFADARNREAFTKALTGELVPRIEEAYRTSADRRHRAVVGIGDSSGSALSFAFRQSETFGKVGGLGAFFFDLSGVEELVKTPQEVSLEIFYGWGTYDLRSPHEAWDMVENSRGLWSLLRERGYRPAGGETADGAGWFVWKARTDDLLRALFPMAAFIP